MIKTLSLSCTNENLLKTYTEDHICRNVFLHRFIDLLSRLDESTIIALDGSWGSGKTFFVRQIKSILESQNPFLNQNETQNSELLSQYAEVWKSKHQSKKQAVTPHVCVYYDAWAHDADEDPLLSLIFDIYSTAKHEYSFAELNLPTSLLSELIQINLAFTAQSAVTLSPFGFAGKKFTKGNEFIDSLKTEQDLARKIREFLDALLHERGTRLVVFVDELDRCRPSYAIRLLEKVKHYFDNENITFVFSIDSVELQATVKQYYGNDFNAGKYLDRFFDLRVGLPPIDTEEYLSGFGLNKNQAPAIHAVVNQYGFQMREITRYVRLLKIALPTTKYSMYTGTTNASKFCHGLVVPIMIGLRLHDAKRYHDFINGNDPTPLYILASKELVEVVFPNMLTVEKQTRTMQESSIDEVYHHLFPSDNSPCEEIRIGKLNIPPFIIGQLQEIGCLMSDLSNYNN